MRPNNRRIDNYGSGPFLVWIFDHQRTGSPIRICLGVCEFAAATIFDQLNYGLYVNFTVTPELMTTDHMTWKLPECTPSW
jgi:hypothetical protein